MIVQAHSADGAHASKLADLRTALSVARGHAQGLRARADESEQALSGVRARALRAEHAAREALDKLVVARAEAAERQVEGQAATQRARELQQELATAEQSGRQLQNEVQRVREALNALQGEHRQRLQELHGTLKATREAALELGASVIDVVSGARTPATAPEAEVSEELTVPGTSLGFEAVEALEKKLQVSEARVQELEAALAGRASREVGVSTLKGELIDVRASAARVADDLAKERARRRKIGVTVRALQAASESGEDVAPWVEEVLAILAEGATIPPPR
jgi:predicted  nucleic acid-binding Zn-ribbon protein